jgi:hypothetical protein
MKVHIMLGMNKLDTETRAQILSMLCEGASMRSVSRLTDTSINTAETVVFEEATPLIHPIQAFAQPG